MKEEICGRLINYAGFKDYNVFANPKRDLEVTVAKSMKVKTNSH